MLGAIYIGLSGMDAYAKGLQTISNNVANLNTLGYKSTSVTFSDLFSRGGGGLTYLGGSQGQQSGNGVRFGQTNVEFRQGDLRQSNGDLDLAIQGSGFLVLLDGDKTYYGRTGQFVVDNDGYISEQGTNFHLAVLDANHQPVALNIDTRRTSQPKATTTVTFADNLSSTATDATVSSLNVFDSAGGKHVWAAKFTPVGAGSPGQWTVTVTDESGATVGTSTLKFIGGTVDPTTAKMTMTSAPAGASALSVILDFSTGVTSFSAGTTSTLRAAKVDGNGVGALTSVTVDTDGNVKLTYSNSQTDLVGAVALADFRDPQQLERVGNGLFQNKGGGQSRLLASGKDGIGSLVSKQVEASNVDLSQEFGDLILIQRGFQASSQVVSVSNDMIQELFGIRGHGVNHTARDWLPLNIVSREAIRTRIASAIDEWSRSWFATSRVSISNYTPTKGETVEGRLGEWRSWGAALALSAPARIMARMLDRALDISLDQAEVNPADRTVIEALGKRIIEDLVARLEAALGLDPTARREPIITGDPLGSDGGLIVTLADEVGAQYPSIAISLAALTPICRGQLSPRSRKASGLKPMVKALGGSAVTLEAVLGEAEISLAELRDLQPGDVLILNTALQDPASLRLPRSGDVIARAALTDADGQMALTLQA